MKKEKIIFIGDFKETISLELLKSFVRKYGYNYSILVTGYNYNYVQNNESVQGHCIFSDMNSSLFFYYKHTASYVVITTPAPRFIKEKTNQEVIYIIEEFDEKLFSGCFGDIKQIILNKRESFQHFTNDHKQVNSIYIDSENEDYASSAIDALEIDLYPENLNEEYIIFSLKSAEDWKYNISGAAHLLEQISKNRHANVICMSEKASSLNTTSTILFHNVNVIKKVLEKFEGTIVFMDEIDKTFFEGFVGEKSIKVNTEKKLFVEDLQLNIISSLLSGSFDDEVYDDNAYTLYRSFLENAYEKNRYDEIKVSVIICHYNTPKDLLVRSISSVLNNGHENVEVILVDDGSKERIETELKETIDDDRLKYYYKDNEGLGLSRNYGVRKAEGEYVYYLDSDDTLCYGALKYMLSHAALFDLDLVKGKRILCDKDGIPMSESLKHLSGSLFSCYYSCSRYSGIYTDVMVNNMLLRKKAIYDNDIWFNEGLYEDVDYSPRFYSCLFEYHYINIPAFYWYQYGTGTTISSSISIENFRARLNKEESAWTYIPEIIREKVMGSTLTYNFNRYLNSYRSFTDEERDEVFTSLQKFIFDRREYVNEKQYAEKVRELTKTIIANDKTAFDATIRRYYVDDNAEGEACDNYIILTHYHLYVACLYAITNKRKSRLFICQSYISFDTKLVYKIKQSGLFEEVTTFVYGSLVGDMFNEIRRRPGEEELIIPDFLYNKFNYVFKNCSPEIDTCYIFSDTHPYWYYVQREFNNIVKLEDAYNSFDREVNMHQMEGIWAGIQKYQGDIFPKMFFRDEKIKKIILSSRPNNIPEFFHNKIEIRDTKEIEKANYEEIKKAMSCIYDVGEQEFPSGSVMLLTQPLALFGYCTEEEQRKLVRKMCEPFKGRPLFIKPHPGDKMDYSFLGGTILPRSFQLRFTIIQTHGSIL